jgi:uncharacterized membrane protein YcjF (UPF0283 family)
MVEVPSSFEREREREIGRRRGVEEAEEERSVWRERALGERQRRLRENEEKERYKRELQEQRFEREAREKENEARREEREREPEKEREEEREREEMRERERKWHRRCAETARQNMHLLRKFLVCKVLQAWKVCASSTKTTSEWHRTQGTQLTCFTGTKVQILTQKALLESLGLEHHTLLHLLTKHSLNLYATT